MGHRFNPAHLQRLLSPEREKMLPPSWVLQALSVTEGLVVADIGAGPGFFVLPAAKMTNATVYGVDVEPQMLEVLRDRANEAGLTRVETREGNAQAIPLPDQAVDRALCAFVLHEVENLDSALQELMRITKAGGSVGILEWEKAPTASGPPVEERLEADFLLQALQNVGFTDIEHKKPNEDQYMFVCRVH